MMCKELEVYKGFMDEWPDGKRHRLVADCEDWDKITPALVSWGNMLGAAIGTQNANMILGLQPLNRCLIEAVYCMGYERGKRERAMPEFIVVEEHETN